MTELEREGFQNKINKLKLTVEMLMLFAMDEDNVWDLDRADEIRITIREYAKKALEDDSVLK